MESSPVVEKVSLAPGTSSGGFEGMRDTVRTEKNVFGILIWLPLPIQTSQLKVSSSGVIRYTLYYSTQWLQLYIMICAHYIIYTSICKCCYFYFHTDLCFFCVSSEQYCRRLTLWRKNQYAAPPPPHPSVRGLGDTRRCTISWLTQVDMYVHNNRG